MIGRLLFGLTLYSFVILMITIFSLILPMILNMGIGEWTRFKENMNKIKRNKESDE